MAAQVKQRLDELFPEAPQSDEELKEAKRRTVYSLAKLKSIARSLELKIPRPAICAYREELGRLSMIFSDDRLMARLVTVQDALCAYLEHPRGRARPQALALLLECFTVLEALAGSGRMPLARRQRLVSHILREYAALRAALKHLPRRLQPAAPASDARDRFAARAAADFDHPPRRVSHGRRGDRSRLPTEAIDDLKGFFRTEITRLREALLEAVRRP
jgi:hypothetical protein